jgi:hypothetical protein
LYDTKKPRRVRLNRSTKLARFIETTFFFLPQVSRQTPARRQRPQPVGVQPQILQLVEAVEGPLVDGLNVALAQLEADEVVEAPEGVRPNIFDLGFHVMKLFYRCQLHLAENRLERL